MGYKDKDLIALTHVCRAWREIFISCSSLWTNFDCTNADKTRVYLERSKSSPINLWLDGSNALSPSNPFLQVIPHSVPRLKSLSVVGGPESLQDITAHLSRQAPLLMRLDMDGGSLSDPDRNPMLTTTLFDGNLSSLRELRLQSVRTKLPWRNMVNLTSFTLCHTSPGDLTITQLLDFFESAPRLRNIKLDSATPASGGRNGRLVSLGYLKRMYILRGGPSSLLLDHLVIPAGAKLTEWVPSFGAQLENYLPKSLDNLRNIPNFTKVYLRLDKRHRILRLSGPSGKLSMVSPIGVGYSALECLARFDTSKAERLEAVATIWPSIMSYEGLLHLRNLRTLTLSRCRDPHYFMENLYPGSHSDGVMACPGLDELIFVSRTDTEELTAGKVIEFVAARASRGAKLKTVRILDVQNRLKPEDVSELRKHVSHVEYGSEVDVVSSDDDDSGEEC